MERVGFIPIETAKFLSLGQRGLLRCMAAAALLACGGVAAPASAQGPGGLYWQCAPASSANGNQAQYCPVSTTYPFPVSQEVKGWTPVAGAQRGVAIATSTALTVPAGATIAVVQAQGTGATSGGQCAFWQDDGTAPTATAGQILVPNQTLTLSGVSLTAFRVIAASGAGAACTISASYYK